MTVTSDTRQFNRILRRSILLPVLFIFIIGLILAFTVNQLFEISKAAENSQQTLTVARTCEKDMIDMETGLRGYFLTNDPVFLQPYREALSRQENDFSTLQNLASQDPIQNAQVQTIRSLKDGWITDAARRVELHAGKAPPTLDYYLNAKNFMDTLRRGFDAFTSRENNLLENHFAQVRKIRQVMTWGSLALLLILAFLVSRNVWGQLTELAGLYRQALLSEYEKNQELVRSKTELMKQKEWFRVTLTSIGDAVMVTDPQGLLVFMNAEAERLSGWSMPEAMLKPLHQVFNIVNETSRAIVENPVDKVYREKKVVGMANHTVLIAKDHLSECAIEDSAAPIYGEEGEILGVVLVFHDASAMRNAEHVLRKYNLNLETQVQERTAKLQKALTEMETFSFTVSHDLRSPLRAMQGYAEAVLEDFGDKLTEEGRRYLSRIKNAAERLDRLIQDLLAYTRVSREDHPLSPVQIDTLTRDILHQYENLQEADADIEITGTLPPVLGHESALVQVFSNLLGNAVKFVPPGVRPQVKIEAEDKSPYTRIWIKDNGIGIDPHNHDRIFKMFEKANDSSLYSGTGVGLAIVKRAVENMHGAVGLESVPGSGSKFWIELKKATL